MQDLTPVSRDPGFTALFIEASKLSEKLWPEASSEEGSRQFHIRTNSIFGSSQPSSSEDETRREGGR
jgi:hypothetical protein